MNFNDIKTDDGFELHITPGGDFEIVSDEEATVQLVEYLLAVQPNEIYSLKTWPANLIRFHGRRIDNELLADIEDAIERSLSHILDPNDFTVTALVDQNVKSVVKVVIIINSGGTGEVVLQVRLSTQDDRLEIERL